MIVNSFPLMEKTWRWFGPQDPVSLAVARQAGATGIVSSLHHLPKEEIWPLNQIQERQAQIAKAGMYWAVVESLPVHEDIKLRTGHWQQHIRHYQQSLLNLAKCGVKTVCYNFMPALDWTRTDLHFELPSGGTALRFDLVDLAAFDLFILKREGAEQSYEPYLLAKAEARYAELSSYRKRSLTKTVLAGLPGAEEHYTRKDFQRKLHTYKDVSAQNLQDNLIDFLHAVIPVAEEQGIALAIHPDDPPFDLFGLPRIVSTSEDLQRLFSAVPSLANGLTFCTGSLGVRPDNKLGTMLDSFGQRIHFLHLRNIQREQEGSFFEANHLLGSVDMYEIVKKILLIQKQRGMSIPMRPDHGHRLASDQQVRTNPGYTAVGRLKGLAELSGLELAIARSCS